MFEFAHTAFCLHCNTQYAALTQESAREKVFRCTNNISGLIDKTED